MKVLDASSLHSMVEQIIKEIDSFYNQLSAIQRAVRDINALDYALTGKSGEAIRNFYNDCHQPFLIFLYQSLVNFQNELRRMKIAIDSYESNKNGFISQQFLIENVESGYENVRERTIELTNSSNSIIESIQDLIVIKKIDESEVIENVQRGKDKVKNIIENLYSLDKAQITSLESVKQDLHTMRNYISDIESKFKNGDLTIQNYSLKIIQDLNTYQSIMGLIYGRHSMDIEAFQLLFEKMLNDEILKPAEQNLLYYYFQYEYLSQSTKKEIQAISYLIDEARIEELKERLNDKVVVSLDNLENEMALIQAYLFLGNKRPSESQVNDDIRAKLETYLMLLKNYHTSISNGNVIIIKKLNYKKYPNDIPGHYIYSAIQTAEYDPNNEMMGREEFREWRLGSDSAFWNDTIISEITYFGGANATFHHMGIELEKLEDKQANYTSDFFIKETLGKLVSEFANKLKIGEELNIVKLKTKYQEENEEIEGDIIIKDAQRVAMMLYLEFAISKNYFVPESGERLYIQLFPSDSTYEILKRWKEVHNINPEIPYPENQIFSNDWYKISETLVDIEQEFGKSLIQYILVETLDDNQTINEIAIGKH